MTESALTAVVDHAIWSLVRPVWFGGVRLRARTTVVRLADDGLLERPAHRLIVGHADVIADNCCDRLAEAWRREGVDV